MRLSNQETYYLKLLKSFGKIDRTCNVFNVDWNKRVESKSAILKYLAVAGMLGSVVAELGATGNEGNIVSLTE